ncbi:MAG: bifunctional phosphoribosylaminoimidazolecarboxamide formyltransferase/IMP cyclohydrolase [candidate division Zixibacteria bacterium]|nr:bifunctional phosphoribosylaminoimidazolecarboxamide formyltransferase/IMP cyclohydrolase [candidate division Zixibacteria bacterium]
MTEGKSGLIKIRRALLSVSDKTNLIELAKALSRLGVEIISTGGTQAELKKAGIKSITISSFTGFPEILGGRVKTLHPKVFGGILAKREDEEQKKELTEQDIKYIDLVVVNLYPFGKVISQKEVKQDEAIENIDIGGPSMLRAAAKNHNSVAVVVNPQRYDEIIKELETNEGSLSLDTRLSLASEVFQHTAYYDSLIANYFKKLVPAEKDEYPEYLTLGWEKAQNLRYGENPHQKAAFYKDPAFKGASISRCEILSGKELSYNNINDLDAALAMLEDFSERPFAVILKHTNPCGAACADSLDKAYEDALACDPVSAFGCIIGLNQVIDMETAKKIHDTFFVECVLAPGYEPEAFELLKKKKNRRFLACPDLLNSQKTKEDVVKVIKGGALLQTPDDYQIKESELKVVTEIPPSPEQINSLLFAWRMVKHVKSNAILLAQGEKTVGIGAGQMSRVDSSIIAARKAGEKAKDSVLASDAFFPKRDGVDTAAKAGVKAIIQPGGSKGDQEVIQAANEHKIAMVFTGIRHFRHS